VAVQNRKVLGDSVPALSLFLMQPVENLVVRIPTENCITVFRRFSGVFSRFTHRMDKYSFDKPEAVSVENPGNFSCQKTHISVFHRPICASWRVALPLQPILAFVAFSTGGKGCG
jgi:hypothetical protein